MMSRRSALAATAALLLLGSTAALALTPALGDAAGLVVGVPRHGDHVAYVNSTGGPAFLAFRWNGSAEVRDDWGRLVPVDRLDMEWVDPEPVEYGYLGGEIAPLYRQGYFGGWTSNGGIESGLLGPRAEVRVDRTWFQTDYSVGLHFALCLARAGWQGVAFDDLPTIDADAWCPTGELVGAFRDAGPDLVGDLRVRSFDVDLASEHALRVSFAPGLAYPVRLLVTPPEDAAPGAEPFEIRLSGFQPGDGAGLLPPHRIPPGGRDPSLFAETPTHGLADGGSGVDLTPEDAWSAVESSPTVPEYREWRRAHANQAPWLASLILSDDAPCQAPGTAADSVTWHFWIDGGDGTHAFTAADVSEGCPGSLPRLPPVLKGAVPDPGVRTLASIGESVMGPHLDFPDRGLTLAAALGIFEEERRTTGAPASFVVARAGTADEASAEPATIYLSTEPGVDVEAAGENVLLEFESGRVISRSWVRNVTVSRAATDGHLLVLGSGGAPTPPVPPFAAFSLAVEGVPEGIYWTTSALSALALVILALGARLPAAVAFLYTRLTRSDVLEQPARSAILDAVRARPGIATTELQESLGLGNGTAIYHLGVLVRAGHLVRVESGQFTRYFPAGYAPRDALREEAVRLDAGTEARVLALLAERPGAHAAEVARALGVSRPTAHNVVERLARRGLVEKRREGRVVQLFTRR